MKRIHINSNTIKSNAKHGKNDPAITIRKGQKVETYAHEVIINGASRVVYRPDKPLVCGAKVWIETDAEVIPIIFEDNIPPSDPVSASVSFSSLGGESDLCLDTCPIQEVD